MVQARLAVVQLAIAVPPLAALKARAVKPVIALPPLLAGARQVTATWASPGAASTANGAVGAARGVPATRGLEGRPVPAAFDAETST
jgi:hypothetical protein